uniref:Uncharacterized protein n=1 Tax=Meloidogyne enterolobii TaxID=390850 RepID=A0A6V7TTG5_MELEN|nr:unnamed protein product [Meloidogyne enterolobii]
MNKELYIEDPEKSYRKRAMDIKNAINQAPEYGQIDILINTVKMAINENNKDSPFPEMNKKVKRVNKTADLTDGMTKDLTDEMANDLTKILKKFSKSI